MTTTATIEALDRMRDLLAKPGVWIKDSLCTTAGGSPGVAVEEADCFCLFGAECRVNPPGNFEPRQLIERAIRIHFPGRGNSIPAFNDHPDTTLEDVLRVIDHAKELASR